MVIALLQCVSEFSSAQSTARSDDDFCACQTWVVWCVWPGVTQEQIDETRLLTELTMLADMQNILNDGGNFELRGQSGETPVAT